MAVDHTLFGDFSDNEIRKEAAAWARLEHEGPSVEAAYRVIRLLGMLDVAEQRLQSATTRIRQLDSMMEDLFKAYMESEANGRRIQARADDAERCLDDFKAAYGPACAQQGDVLPFDSEDTPEEVDQSFLWQMGVARDKILDTLAAFKRVAPGSMFETLGRDIRKLCEA